MDCEPICGFWLKSPIMNKWTLVVTEEGLGGGVIRLSWLRDTHTIVAVHAVRLHLTGFVTRVIEKWYMKKNRTIWTLSWRKFLWLEKEARIQSLPNAYKCYIEYLIFALLKQNFVKPQIWNHFHFFPILMNKEIKLKQWHLFISWMMKYSKWRISSFLFLTAKNPVKVWMLIASSLFICQVFFAVNILHTLAIKRISCMFLD